MERSMEYPKWAPRAVCELHERTVSRMNLPHDETAQFRPSYFEEPIYRRLVYDHRMKYAWAELSKRGPQPNGTVRGVILSVMHQDGDKWLCFVANVVVKAVFEATREFESRAKKKNKYQSIATASTALADMLEKTDLGEGYIDGGAMRLLPDTTLAAILSRFDPARFEGDYCDTWHFMSPEPLPDSYIPDRRICRSDSAPVGPALSLTRDLYGSFVDYMCDERRAAPTSPMYWPSVPEVLRKLASDAAKIAMDADHEPRIVERDTKNRVANHAIRLIAKELLCHTGMKLKGTVATLASVGLDWHESLSESDVEAALKGFDLSP